MIIVYVVVICALFYALGMVADRVIAHIREVARRLGVSVFFLGLFLGIFTSLAELSIGIGALMRNTQALTVGNLLGGIVVLMGFILGLGLVFNRTINTDGHIKTIVPYLVFILLPFILGSDKTLSRTDGVIMLVAYVALLGMMYYHHHVARARDRADEKDTFKPETRYKTILVVTRLLGWLVLAFMIAQGIVELAMRILPQLGLSAFVVGIVVFSIGTNLPELMVTIRSWRRHITSLSLSTILGSAMANVMIAGLFALARPIDIITDDSFVLLAIVASILGLFFLVFYKTGRVLTRREGVVLLIIYALFLAVQITLIQQ